MLVGFLKVFMSGTDVMYVAVLIQNTWNLVLLRTTPTTKYAEVVTGTAVRNVRTAHRGMNTHRKTSDPIEGDETALLATVIGNEQGGAIEDFDARY